MREIEQINPTNKSKGLSEPVMYKNKLQEYTQKLGLPLPEYRIRNEGFPHAPKSRSCVSVKGKGYASRGAFPQRKEAEQDAAKVALENITQTRNDGGRPCIQWRIDASSFHIYSGFGGEVYKGEEARSKKIAEHLAARVAIRSLLESDSGILQQIINSKSTVLHSVPEVKNPSSNQSNLPASSTQASSGKANDISRSTSKLTSVGPTVNCSGESKRKPQESNCTQKKLRRDLQF